MPKETFFRLPEDKQQRLLQAARKEFERVPLQEVSIANIVREAKIPRGSFYQYFEDKEDLYYFYHKKLKEEGHFDFEYFLVESQGDLFKATETYFYRMLPEFIEGPHAEFYQNFFMFMDYHGTSKLSPELTKEVAEIERKKSWRHQEHMKHGKRLLDRIDASKLKFKDEASLVSLARLLASMVLNSVNHAYKLKLRNESIDLDEMKHEFSRKLIWLKYGVYQSEEGENEWENY